MIAIKTKKKEIKDSPSKRRKKAKGMHISDSRRAAIIKKEIADGTYIVKSEDIAMKIVQKMRDCFFYKIT